ncbi:LuxR C-terminal-related transcriptional regulator [Hydrogenobacter thermophilus]|uniref:helix-turn-helix transcriptional regulator n=1 Tax=Hydrogenobacter thermophilus TaxID=940 RepID=UPI0030FA1784
MFALFSLSSFVLWLISFPMAGFLLKDFDLLPYFLAGHIGGFVSILFLRANFYNLAPVFLSVTMLLTASFTYLDLKPITMFFIGFFSSYFAVLVGHFLTESPKKRDLLGLVLGNVGVSALYFLPVKDYYKFLIISFLPSINFYRKPITFSFKTIEKRIYLRFLLSIFVLYITGGLMYKNIMEIYSIQAFVFGIEVFFYAFAVLLAYFMLMKNTKEEHLLVSAVISYALAYSLMHFEHKMFLNIMMYLIQFGFGFADAYLLYTLINLRNPLLVFPVGFSTVCVSIMCGYYLGKLISHPDFLIAVGNIILVSFSLYTFYVAKTEKVIKEKMPKITQKVGAKEFIESLCVDLQKYDKRLSRREIEVMSLMLEGKSNEEIAKILGISISSVREYSRRALEKIDKDREELSHAYMEWLKGKSL